MQRNKANTQLTRQYAAEKNLDVQFDDSRHRIRYKIKNNLIVVPSMHEGWALKGKRIILMTHGVGDSYLSDNRIRSFPGGVGRDHIQAFLVPNEVAAQANGQFYDKPIHIVGCPKLDKWANYKKEKTGTICISFTWDRTFSPEGTSAYSHYKSILPELAKRYTVIGHGHPLVIDELEKDYNEAGIETVKDFEEVMKRADLYIVDSSSTLWEFAVIGPVMLLNAPWYRKDVEHGMRFWKYSNIGIQIDSPQDLIDAIPEALEDKIERRPIIDKVYPHLGNASQKAVEAILTEQERTL